MFFSSVATFTVDQQGRLTSASSTPILITASQVSDFATSAETAIFTTANFVDSTTIDFTVTEGDSVTARVIKTPGTLSAGTGITSFTFDGSSNAEVAVDLTSLDSRYVNITGDTMTGGLTVQGTVSATTIDGLNILSGGTNIIDIINNLDDDIYLTGDENNTIYVIKKDLFVLYSVF